jgi:hypothetical protein
LECLNPAFTFELKKIKNDFANNFHCPVYHGFTETKIS